jgi:hypothetical protein
MSCVLRHTAYIFQYVTRYVIVQTVHLLLYTYIRIFYPVQGLQKFTLSLILCNTTIQSNWNKHRFKSTGMTPYALIFNPEINAKLFPETSVTIY